MNLLCPLSNSSNVLIVETISVHDLMKTYEPFQLDISSELQGEKEVRLCYCCDSDLFFFDPPISGSEKFYEHMQKYDWYYLDDKFEYEYASKLINCTDAVIEIGCGKGAFAHKIASKNYVGLEFSRKASQVAVASGLRVLNETIEFHSKQYSGYYDVACAFQVIEHVADLSLFIKSSLNCLKTSGLLIFSVPSHDSFSKYVTNHSLDMPPHHLTRWTDTALCNIANYFPIELVDIVHEPLYKAHDKMYFEALLRKTYLNYRKQQFKNIDFSLTTSFISLLAKYATQIFSGILVNPIFSPRGMSVIAVYRKK